MRWFYHEKWRHNFTEVLSDTFLPDTEDQQIMSFKSKWIENNLEWLPNFLLYNLSWFDLKNDFEISHSSLH